MCVLDEPDAIISLCVLDHRLSILQCPSMVRQDIALITSTKHDMQVARAAPNTQRMFRSRTGTADPDHTKRTQHGASKAPRSPHAGPRTGERAAPRVACTMYEVRMSTRNFRAHDAPATERHGEMARSGRLTAVSKSSGCLSTIWQCNRTLDLFCAMGTIGAHLACLCAPSRTSLALRRWIWL